MLADVSCKWTYDFQRFGLVPGYLSVQDKGAAKSAKHAGGPSQVFRGLILAVDPTQSLRGPSPICHPFSQKRASILRGSVPSFRPCPG